MTMINKIKINFVIIVLFFNIAAFAQSEEEQFVVLGNKVINCFINKSYDTLTNLYADEQKLFNSPLAIASYYNPLIEKYGEFATFRFAGFKAVYSQVNIDYVIKTKYNIEILVELVFERETQKFLLYRFNETFRMYAIPDYAIAEKFNDETIVFSADTNLPLNGILSLPKVVKKVPLVIIVPAAGPSDADGNFNSKPYKDLATGLATKGFAVFRYNKRSLNYGFNFSQNKFNGNQFTPEEDVLADLQAVIDLFKKNPNIDSNQIYLLGHGEGAYFAPYIASKNPNIKGIIMMGANANHPLQMMIEQNNYLSKILPHKKEHYDEDNLKAQIVLKKKVTENTSYMVLPHEIPAKYWLWIQEYDQIKVAKKLTIPIFIMQGGRDYQVDKKNFFVWQKKLKKNKNVTFKLYEKMNHIMHAGEGESTYSEYSIMRHIPVEVIDDLTKWLNSK